MIVRPHATLCELLFAMQGSIVPRIAPQIIAAALLGCVAAAARLYSVPEGDDAGTRGAEAWATHGFTFTPFTALGVAISLFLGFRNNASYDRWWEARKQWGMQLITVRNLARKLLALRVPAPARRNIVRLSVAQSHALRIQLREKWVGDRRPRSGCRPARRRCCCCLWSACCHGGGGNGHGGGGGGVGGGGADRDARHTLRVASDYARRDSFLECGEENNGGRHDRDGQSLDRGNGGNTGSTSGSSGNSNGHDGGGDDDDGGNDGVNDGDNNGSTGSSASERESISAAHNPADAILGLMSERVAELYGPLYGDTGDNNYRGDRDEGHRWRRQDDCNDGAHAGDPGTGAGAGAGADADAGVANGRCSSCSSSGNDNVEHDDAATHSYTCSTCSAYAVVSKLSAVVPAAEATKEAEELEAVEPSSSASSSSSSSASSGWGGDGGDIEIERKVQYERGVNGKTGEEAGEIVSTTPSTTTSAPASVAEGGGGRNAHGEQRHGGRDNTSNVARHRWKRTLDTFGVVAITEIIDVLGAVQGACERIAVTPLPWPYVLLVHRTSYLYVLLAPFAMAEEMGW